MRNNIYDNDYSDNKFIAAFEFIGKWLINAMTVIIRLLIKLLGTCIKEFFSIFR